VTDHCKWCGSVITFALSEKGKRMPVEMTPDGDLILLPVAPGFQFSRTQNVGPPGSGAEVRTPRYANHIARCKGKRGRKREAPQAEKLEEL
jgi:hypothetical protein